MLKVRDDVTAESLMGLKELLKRRRNTSTHSSGGTRGRKALKTTTGQSAKDNEILDTPQSTTSTPKPSEAAAPEVKIEVKSDAEQTQVEDLFERYAAKTLTDTETLRLKANRVTYTPSSFPAAKGPWPDVEIAMTEESSSMDLKANLSQCGIHSDIQCSWRQLHERSGRSLLRRSFVDGEQQLMLSLFSDYRNVFYNMKRYSTKEEGYARDDVLSATVLHCVSHVRWSKTRLQNQIRSRERAKKLKRAGADSSVEDHPSNEGLDRRILKEEPDSDRILGFAFPKVLFLVPMRNVAYNIVDQILSIASPDQTGLDKVREKLRQSYGPDEALEAAFKRQKKTERNKPPDHEAIFYGHVADTVSIGIKMHLNGEIGVFRPLAESDIFVASPLSLALLLEKNERETTDLLSSIEILVIDRAEVLSMQNWTHVLRCVKHLNRTPTEPPTDVNMLQVRRYFLQNQGALYRQTLILSAFATAEMNALFNGPLCCNHAGRVCFRPSYSDLLAIDPSKKTLYRFERYSCPSVESSADSRLAYFKRVSMPKIRDSGESGLLVFVPLYFDFVRVCDIMSTEGISFGGLCEYTGDLKTTRLRRQFREGEIRVLVTTERFYFYNRSRFKGVSAVFFYSLPDHRQFFPEIVALDQDQPRRITVLFSRFTALQLERIAGAALTRKLLYGSDDVLIQSN